MGELPTLVTGRGAARPLSTDSVRGVAPSSLLGALSEAVRVGERVMVTFAASEARAFARAEIFSNLCFFSAILLSSNLIFFTKSLTSPVLQYPNIRIANEVYKIHSLERILQVVQAGIAHLPNFGQGLCTQRPFPIRWWILHFFSNTLRCIKNVNFFAAQDGSPRFLIEWCTQLVFPFDPIPLPL